MTEKLYNTAFIFSENIFSPKQADVSRLMSADCTKKHHKTSKF